MHNKHGGSIRSHNCYLKRCVKKHFSSFHVMESRASSNCTRNIYRPSTAEKEVNRKENTVGKTATRRQIATDSKVYAYSDTDLNEVLFHYVMFYDNENRDLSSKIYRVPFDGISYDLLDRKTRLCPSKTC